MTLPGTIVSERDAATPRTLPTDTGVGFVAGLAERGPVGTATLCRSLDAVKATYGDRIAASPLIDTAETFFREGGTALYVSRIVGPSPVAASVTVEDGSNVNALKIAAAEVGTFANAWDAEIESSGAGHFTIVITDGDGVEIARSPDFTTKAGAVAWAPAHGLAVTALGGGLPAVAAAASLTGGTDDRASVTDAHRVAALDAFPADLGPGQVSIPGATTLAAWQGTGEHALATNRVAYLDVAVDDADAVIDDVAAFRALGDVAKVSAFFDGAETIPGLVSGTVRTVPASARAMGQAARVDALGNPNVAAAGERGIAAFVIGTTSAARTDAEREALNDAGVNVSRVISGQVRTYGFRTAAAPADYPLHWQLANVRLDMAVRAECQAAAESHVFAQIDGKGVELAAYAGKLAGVLSRFYRIGALYGETPDDAYRVDVGPAVNTPETIAAGRIRAVLSIVRSPFAERAEVEVVKTPVGQPV